jgi:hypothetical protein
VKKQWRELVNSGQLEYKGNLEISYFRFITETKHPNLGCQAKLQGMWRAFSMGLQGKEKRKPSLGRPPHAHELNTKKWHSAKSEL